MNALKTVRMRPATCPYCRATITAASSAAGATPTPGDVTVCLYCGRVLAFTDALALRVATPADLGALDDEARATLGRYRRLVLARIGLN